MKQTKRRSLRRNDPATATVTIDGKHAVAVSRGEGRALVRVTSGDQRSLEFEIAFTPAGPVVRARAAALELDADGPLTARCDDFRVEARGELSLSAGGRVRVEGRAVDVVAQRGNVTLQANDDVQCLGEQVLLNCDRTPAVPAWVPTVAWPAPPTPTVERVNASGDVALFDALDRSKP